jgi:hypothetical protein
MTNQTEYTVQVNRTDAGVSDLLGSMFGLAAAGAKFSFQQVENAMSMFTDSQKVMNRVRNTMDKLSEVMSGETETSTMDPLAGPTGRKT